MFESRISTSTGRMSSFASFAPVRMAMSAINGMSSMTNLIGTASTSIAMSKVGLGGIFVAVAVTALGSLGCGRLFDALLEEEPPIAQTPLTDSGLDVVNIDGEAGLPEADTGLPDVDAGLDGDALINPDVFDAAEAEADAIILPDAPDADEADAPIIPDVIEAGDADANPPIDADADVIVPPDGDSGPVCVPVNFTYNNFDLTTGIYNNTEAVNNLISLQKAAADWTCNYDANELPENATPANCAWTKQGTINTPMISGGILYYNTQNNTDVGYYTINPNPILLNATGGIFDATFTVETLYNQNPTTSKGFEIDIADGVKEIRFGFFNGPDRICDKLNGTGCFQVPGGITNKHRYTIWWQGSSFKLFVDTNLLIDGTGVSLSDAGGQRYLKIGDLDPGIAGCGAAIDNIRFLSSGNSLYKPTGTYTPNSPINSGIAGNDWTGTQISWLPASALNSVSVAIRTGDDPASLQAASYGSEFTSNPFTVPAGVLGKLVEIRLRENARPESCFTESPSVASLSAKKDCADK